MLRRRSGFTLIELLMVIVIIGVLAAIAMPKFSKTRERAHFKAMMSDLRQLMTQQETYWSNSLNGYVYASNLALLPNYETSSAETLGTRSWLGPGWVPTAAMRPLRGRRTCRAFLGRLAPVPARPMTP